MSDSSEPVGVPMRLDIGRYVIVPEWVYAQASGTALVVYVALALHADRDTGACWPSRPRIARLARISVRTVDTALRDLVRIGAISARRRRDPDGGVVATLYLVHATPPAIFAGGPPAKSRTTPPANIAPELEPEEQLEPEEHVPNSVRDVDTVWQAYADRHPRARRSAQRVALIRRRLREFDAAMLVDAIRGNHESDYHVEKGYHDLGLILRDADHVERFAAAARKPATRRLSADDQPPRRVVPISELLGGES